MTDAHSESAPVVKHAQVRGNQGPRRFLVTGAASGIGLAVAQLAISHGARVAMLDYDGARLDQACTALGSAALALTCDVTDTAAVDAAMARAVDWLGGVDAVVNSAGVDALGSIEKIDLAAWSRTLAVNLTGPMLVCRAALPHLRAGGGGSIVNIASAAGLSPMAHRTAYCASKAGLIMFGKALALEVAEGHIRVNAVCPGAIDTPLFRTSYEGSPDPQTTLAGIRARYAMQRVAAPSEVADAVWYLSGPGATYITGAALAVDGGRSFH